jgi:hypothetical protein
VHLSCRSAIQFGLALYWLALPAVAAAESMLYGTILLASRHTPVTSCRVALVDSGGVKHETYTDTSGVYAFRNLPDGVYRLTVLPGGVTATIVDGSRRVNEPVTLHGGRTQLDLYIRVR